MLHQKPTGKPGAELRTHGSKGGGWNRAG